MAVTVDENGGTVHDGAEHQPFGKSRVVTDPETTVAQGDKFLLSAGCLNPSSGITEQPSLTLEHTEVAKPRRKRSIVAFEWHPLEPRLPCSSVS